WNRAAARDRRRRASCGRRRAEVRRGARLSWSSLLSLDGGNAGRVRASPEIVNALIGAATSVWMEARWDPSAEQRGGRRDAERAADSRAGGRPKELRRQPCPGRNRPGGRAGRGARYHRAERQRQEHLAALREPART